jgi:hypothetical protein
MSYSAMIIDGFQWIGIQRLELGEIFYQLEFDVIGAKLRRRSMPILRFSRCGGERDTGWVNLNQQEVAGKN